jgi:hypothetical protein
VLGEEVKIQFTQPELDWLDKYINQMLLASRSRRDMESIERTASKMKYKFAGKPLYVWLTTKERELLALIAGYRADSLRASPSDERCTVNQILEKLGI